MTRPGEISLNKSATLAKIMGSLKRILTKTEWQLTDSKPAMSTENSKTMPTKTAFLIRTAHSNARTKPTLTLVTRPSTLFE